MFCPPELVTGMIQRSQEVGPELQPWQIINLLGIPLVILMYLPMVVQDIGHWLSERKEVSSTRRRN